MNKQKLGNPVFIVSVFLLVLNDWCLKQAYSNCVTGKLSDFAGLFAFAFFVSAFFPKQAPKVYVLTGLLFMLWKSALIQPLIVSLNALGIPINRTVDFTDYVALIILPFSFYIFNRSRFYSLKPAFLYVTIIFSSLAFVATSRPPGADKTFDHINKTYNFNFSKRELIARLNMLQLEYVRDINKYGNGKVDFDSKTNMFYYRDKKDTVGVILDYEKVKDTDTIKLKTSFANINISGNAQSSEIKLLSVSEYVLKSHSGDAEAETVKFFEKNVIKKINSYPK
jgi:hypothetical protein